MVNCTLKNAFYNPSKWCFQICWKYFRFEVARFKIINVKTCIAKQVETGVLSPKRLFLFQKCGAKQTLSPILIYFQPILLCSPPSSLPPNGLLVIKFLHQLKLSIFFVKIVTLLLGTDPRGPGPLGPKKKKRKKNFGPPLPKEKK